MQDRPVPTEAEKYEMKRKRSASAEATQPVEEEVCPCFDETGDYCDECVGMLEEQHAAGAAAGKGPVYRQVDEREDEAEGEDVSPHDDPNAESDLPDLHQYFDHFEIPDEKVISMCRAYASYLSSLRPKKPTNAYAQPRRRTATARQPSPSQAPRRYWEAKPKRKRT